MTKILVVDDDQMLADSIVRLLTEDGHDVSYARSGFEAEGLVQMQGFDVVLCDWDFGLWDLRTGGVIVDALRAHDPDPRYIIWSGCRRDVPEGVEFYLKGDIVGMLERLR